MRFRNFTFAGIRSLENLTALVLALVFIPVVPMTSPIGTKNIPESAVYAQTQPMSCGILPSRVQQYHGAAASPVFLPGTVAAAATLFVLLFSVPLNSVVMPSSRKAIPHLRGPPVL